MGVGDKKRWVLEGTGRIIGARVRSTLCLRPSLRQSVPSLTGVICQPPHTTRSRPPLINPPVALWGDPEPN